MSAIKTSIHGLLAGLDAGDRLVGRNGIAAGTLGKQRRYAGPLISEMWDDFQGKTIDVQWEAKTGSDGAAVAFALVSAVNGAVEGVMGAGAGASMAANGVQLQGHLGWKANQGGLVMEARVKVALITSVAVFIGFTDQVSALEMPATISAGSLTTNFTDGCGFLFDTAATASTWKLVGVANDVDATMQEPVLPGTGSTPAVFSPVAATYATFRITIDTAGAARFYYNDVPVGTLMTGAVTPTVLLTPVICGFRRTATITQLTADYVHVSQTR